MSKETMRWLNTMTLIGFTDKRGHAWSYRASEQGDEPNHYKGAIPIDDVRRRLFDWRVAEGNVTSTATVLSADGVESFTVTDPDRKAMLRPPRALGPNDPGAIMGLFKAGYEPHDYEEWLLNELALLLDDALQIGSAGLLRGGALAWVQIEAPESIKTSEGVEFRPHILATTSFDGSVATTYKRVVTNVVCDNTHAAAMAERTDGGGGQQIKVKHSRYSKLRLADAREALALVHTIADDFSAEVAKLCAVRVSEGDWAKFLDELSPVPEDAGRAKTMSENKREKLGRLWRYDERVAPWRGTAWGVVQAVSTYAHHEGIVRNMDRGERNMLRAIDGSAEAQDIQTAKRILAIAG